ncbi:homeodomain-interacting protein kinase 3-like [Paralichthys olivaceus]|uniref:homeodomain-interacting protein kinase 3-like n=1 Tax=Paralichthys olivaceus TaxID=8255 RepID=UPI00375396E8
MFKIEVGDWISSPTTQYKVQKYLGSGTFGLVTQCRDMITDEMVALKMIKNSIESAKIEAATLQTMKELHSDKFNIVQLKDSFSYKDHYWLVFENLDIDLHKFMEISPGKHLELKQIRPILQQLATSLEFLKRAKFVHADLKPHNIMMVDHVGQPLKVRVIDFGLACNKPEEKTGCVLQSLIYRSPEIIRRVPFNEAIDVWSLGCTAAELLIGEPLFNAWDEFELENLIRIIIGTQLNEQDFKSNSFLLKKWMKKRFMMVPRLWGDDDKAELCDLECFIDLLKMMLAVNPNSRITPTEILRHPFITMSHFEGPFKNSSYVKSCKDLMDICKDDEGHGDQLIQQRSLNKDSSSSLVEEGSHAGMTHEKNSFLLTATITQAKKRKMNKECGNRPEDSQAKKRRTEQLSVTQKEKKWANRLSKVPEQEKEG